MGEPVVGTVVAGRYRLDAELGRGGMGRVFRAHHLDLDEDVALKVLLPGLAEGDEARARFVREAKAAKAFVHPYAVQLRDFGRDAALGCTYLTMDLVPGRTLRAVLRDEKALSPERAVRLGSQVLEVLEAAHRAGVVHRDLKPENLILVERDGAEEVRVLDFGIAKMLGSEEPLTVPGAFVGTPFYASPEQLDGRPVDGRSDLYSLAVVLHECLAGKRPGPPLREVAPHVPAATARAIEHALAKDPDARPVSARAFRLELSGGAPGPSPSPAGDAFAKTVTVSSLSTGSISPAACPACGAPRGSGRFCTRCGLELGDGAPVATPPPPSGDPGARAWRLLRDGRIDEGRTLLRAACARDPLDFDAHVLAAFELQRPPEDRPAAGRYHEAAARLRPDSSEIASLLLIVSFGTSYRTTWDHLQRTRQLTPRSPHGTVIRLVARLFASDLLLQTYRPVGTAVDSVFVNAVVKGAAQLMQRQHDGALATFEGGIAKAARVPGTYEEKFGFTFDPDEARAAARAFERDATIGRALVLLDSGKDGEARAALSELAARFPESAPDAQRLLAAVAP